MSPRAYLILVVALQGCGRPVAERIAAPPVVAGVGSIALSPRVRGNVLLGELGCVACHAGGSHAAGAEARRGPDLAAVGSRVRADHLTGFLLEPHHTEPGTVMPDLLRDLDGEERSAAVAALTRYLWSFSGPAVLGEPHDADAAQRGRELFHSIGCVACHAPRDANGDESELAGSVPLGRVQGKYSLAGLRGFLLAPHSVRPAARMPDFRLQPGEAHDLSHFLLTGAAPWPPHFGYLPGDVVAGRTLFAARGCANCHDLPDAERAPSPRPKPLRELDVTRGCLSDTTGAWPFYPLSAEQRADLTTAIAELEAPLADEARIQQLMSSRNCTACHRRDGLGGIAEARGDFFTTGDPSLGAEGRLPPPLTGVGAKLQHDWLVAAIAHGQAERPYLTTRMPGFGAAFANELAPLLERSDTLPPLLVAPLPDDDKAARAVTDLGRELVGDKGMNCITCHRFAGEQVGAMGGLDLVDTTGERLRPEWFAHFLRDPFQFKPDTLMPQFFPDGVSTRPELGGGDVAKQIDAMWHYLAEGRNVRKPDGIRRPPIELLVADEAVMLRRAVQDTGKRGISVGYPGGVNITFDAESLVMNQIWWGRFIDAAGVWTSQGHGQARILGRRRVTLPNGPAFAPNPDSPWPIASRRELGHQWLGYDLDAGQRPSFRYVCDGVEIVDTPRELREGDAVILRRTLQYSRPQAKTLWFLAARDASIEDLGAGMVQVGKSLRLRLLPDGFRIRVAGDQRELLVPILAGETRQETVIDYLWQEDGK